GLAVPMLDIRAPVALASTDEAGRRLFTASRLTRWNDIHTPRCHLHAFTIGSVMALGVAWGLRKFSAWKDWSPVPYSVKYQRSLIKSCLVNCCRFMLRPRG